MNCINHLLYKCPEEHRFQAAGKNERKQEKERERKKERKIRADNNNLGKGRDREDDKESSIESKLEFCDRILICFCCHHYS